MKKNFKTFYIFLLAVAISFCGCENDKSPHRFQLVPAGQSGVNFSNDLVENTDFNMLNYLYFYDGGGVTIGDVNNDGLPDVYFTSNMFTNKLYLNKGNFQFEDITAKAKVEGTGDWTSGATMADVNGDELLDIYVCNVNYLTKEGKNELFINNGDSTFTEHAFEYGLDFKGYSKHATFFDYDKDGDLDVYLLNHAIHSKSTYTRAENRKDIDSLAGDRLYRNNEGKFVNVSQETGIYSSPTGYGLAVTASDINMDGCPDLYVSNDFHENDYLYLNNCDGTFREVLQESIGHTSRASMGNDVADINNDLWPDIFVLDMLPYDEKTLKSSSSMEPYNVYQIQRDMGYHPQYVRNTLQLNKGANQQGGLFFSEIAQYAGVHATDWSWSSLILDINNNGLKDIVVTNGIYRRPTNLDYLSKISSEKIQESLDQGIDQKDLSLLNLMPHNKVPNSVFVNNGDLTFTPSSTKWGLTESSYSSGMAYGDLDNDGDLDLVINNVNSPAYIYRNNTRERGEGNYLTVNFEGDDYNTSGIGSKLIVWTSSGRYLYEQMLTRGFLSSVEPSVIVGLDTLKVADSLTVVWPDHRYQTLEEVTTNQELTFKQQDASGHYSYDKLQEDPTNFYFKEEDEDTGIKFRHQENSFTDFDQQNLMPHMLSAEGPPIAKGDVNGDGLEDLFIGGAKYQSGKLFVQLKNGSFMETNKLTLRQDEAFEDVDAQFFDANSNGAVDLYVVSGGNEHAAGSKALEDRLYLNDGKGNFVRTYNALPKKFENGSTIATADYDKDGDTDIFIGNRSVPQNYGISPRSYLLENTGSGEFIESSSPIASELAELGMITDAIWVENKESGYKDLVVAGEWMPVTLFRNMGGTLISESHVEPLSGDGWWNKLKAEDFDGDGDMDLIAGNVGLNTFFQADGENPLLMYLKDFNEDGQVDPIIGYTKEGNEYPVAVRDELLLPFPFLRNKFPAYKDYAGTTIQEVFGDHLIDASKKEVHEMRSLFIENKGDGRFQQRPLPEEVQYSLVRAVESGDFNNDGIVDLLIAGNFYPVKPSFGGRHDASYGWYLQGKGDGSFDVVKTNQSGFTVTGETRNIETISRAKGESLIVVTRNDDSIKLFRSVGK